MKPSTRARAPAADRGITVIEKSPTGIAGLDEITYGGLPKGRPTLLCGAAGCGKTLFSMTFLYNGAVRYDEPGVFIAFEERPEELIKNVGSLQYDIQDLIDDKKLAIDYVHIDPNQIDESGEYDLEGLFIRLGFAIDALGAKRVVIDTVETLFGGLQNEMVLRSELRRLFEWLKDKGVSAVITAERGDGTLTRYGLEEYVADCVVLLDHRVNDQMSTRRLRVVKYRGTLHGTDEYPFLIGARGISVLPITSLGLAHRASQNVISSGIDGFDALLGGGFYASSTILVSGLAGTGKSTFAAHFVAAACARNERALYVALEQSPDEFLRNTKTVGLALTPFARRGLLRFHALRPTAHGL